MYYTEWLRVRHVLIWAAIILAAICVIHGAVLLAYPSLVSLGANKQTDGVPLPFFFAVAGLVCTWFACRFARTLSDENDGHLPVVFTRPVSRTQYALGAIAMDSLGMLAIFVMVVVAQFIITGQHKALDLIVVPPDTGIQLVRFLALPFAYYGILMALASWSGKGGRGITWLSYAASYVLLLLAAIGLEAPWGTIVTIINTFNPMAYAGYSYHTSHDTVNIVAGQNVGVSHLALLNTVIPSVDFVALLLLCVAGLVAGIAEWRRVEA